MEKDNTIKVKVSAQHDLSKEGQHNKSEPVSFSVHACITTMRIQML